MALLEVKNIYKSFGGVKAIQLALHVEGIPLAVAVEGKRCHRYDVVVVRAYER